jgi:hypothetical protein
VFFVALRMLEDLSMLDVEQWENITGSENPPSSTDQQQTPNNEVTMTEMTMALAEQKIREETNICSNESGGGEKPPLREVTVDLEIDRQIHRANKTLVLAR